MRFLRKKDNRVLVIGIFQNVGTGRAVLQNLHRARFGRTAAIHASAKGPHRVEERGILAIGASIAALMLSVVLGAFILWARGTFDDYRPAGLAMMLSAFALGGAIIGWILVQLFRQQVDPESLARFTSTILPNETIVLAQVEARKASRVLTILRDVEAEAPVTFAFYPPPPFRVEPIPGQFAHELLSSSSQHYVENAANLAHAITVDRRAKPRGLSFLHRLREIEDALEWANMSLTVSAEAHHGFTLSAEWLLDNAYLIREQVTDLRKSLPQKSYGELPLVASGSGTGLPRVYHVAAQMVTETDGAVEPDIIRKFLVAFQTIMPLDIGELWALPLMLRLQLLETLRTLAIQVEEQQRQSEEADFWANRLIAASRHGSPQLFKIMEELVKRNTEPKPHFASELVAHLYDDEGTLPLVSGWLERLLRSPLLEVMQQEHRRQAVQQSALTNAINSCRRLAQVQWREFFQSVSWAEGKLAADPAGVYARQDFETRDRCRSAVEEIARWSNCSEQRIIDHALALANAAEDEVARHVGYYLIDAGRAALERATGAKVPLLQQSRRWVRIHAAGVYFGNLILITAALVAAPLLLVSGLVSSFILLLLAFLLLLPASELAVLALNYFVTSFLPPEVLPKMSFGKEGIPEDCCTLVVVPMLLTTPGAIQTQLNRLEIHYLGNTDANLRFSLLTDFSDAPRQSMPEDAEYIDIVARGIEELNRRHGAGHFFLFHRGRLWSESEQRWIGWERKRGKLEDLNRFLIGESGPEFEGFLYAGDRAQLKGIRFVITLDADTQLLRDTARRMIETLAHPLNQARLSPDSRHVVRGYTVIQPSVSASLPSATATWFSRIFADPRGIDPYTHAVSDVYQDLVGEGSYHGKGIYELQTFHRLLSGRFPIAHLLSHDLLEGCYVRVGLATDIELLDVFPNSYIAWWSRQHRWIRGDWQIIDWLKSHVPVGGGKVELNPLSAFNRWKIFDNLRRSLVPAAIVALLLAGWFFTPVPMLWSGIIAGLILWPVLNAFLALLFHPPPPGTRFWRDPRDRLLRAMLAVIFLADYAGMALDAIVRVSLPANEVASAAAGMGDGGRFSSARKKSGNGNLFLAGFGFPLSPYSFSSPRRRGERAAMLAMAPFLLLWALFPVAVMVINRPAKSWRGGMLTVG